CLGYYPRPENVTHAAPAPVEATGDLVLMVALEAAWSGDDSFARDHQATLQAWADYLIQIGIDTPVQISSDDFLGPVAGNVNLGLKGALAVAAWARLAERLGRTDATSYALAAKKMYSDWLVRADAGDHLRLLLDG